MTTFIKVKLKISYAKNFEMLPIKYYKKYLIREKIVILHHGGQNNHNYRNVLLVKKIKL